MDDATGDDDSIREWLAVLSKPDGSEPPDTGVVLRNVRTVTAHETQMSKSDSALLHGLTIGSPLQDLRSTSDELHLEMDRLESLTQAQLTVPGAYFRIELAFKAWLSAFTSFADRNKHWISQHAGGKHGNPYRTFDAALSEEFDANFAYRLCSGLRNASQHAGKVINRASFSAREASDGVVEEEVLLQLSCPALAEQFPRMRAKTRQEMLAVTDEVELFWIVGAVNDSCRRLQAQLLVALGAEVGAACGRVEAFDSEVGGKALFEKTGFFDRGSAPDGRSQLSFRPNRGDLAAVARAALTSARDALRATPSAPVWTWQDFVVGGSAGAPPKAAP